ncbi:hypothetical protein SAMN04488025_12836 [Planifilum fulgidum]|jgi:uncharacterized protein YerC|uniref:Uncharacterized protein n=1 Tax=Planifilum fulgidum TaxID=201973 RepID=A0A1I2R5V6_9BACL|nr:hypothetical protein SAMN04488025_12836 [Planifilum fulgidum]
MIMKEDKITLELSKKEAIGFFDRLCRLNESEIISLRIQLNRVLWGIWDAA